MAKKVEKMAKDERFIIKDQDKGIKLAGTKIIVDSLTGVQYLFAWDGYSGGMTILVDKDGKPLLAKD